MADAAVVAARALADTTASILALWSNCPAAREAVGLTVELVAGSPRLAHHHAGPAPDLADTAADRLPFRRQAAQRLVTASLVFEMAVHDGWQDPVAGYVEVFSREFDVVVDPDDVWTRMQTYLEGHPCYPLVYTQAYALADQFWRAPCGGTDRPGTSTPMRERSCGTCSAAGSGPTT